jgi:hypothetical protein
VCSYVKKLQTEVTETRIGVCEGGRTGDEDFREETEIFDLQISPCRYLK